MLARLSSNSIWLLVSRVGTQLALAVYTILVARALGSAGFGQYAFIASVVFIGNVLTTFGTDMLLIREIASTQNPSGVSSALVIQLALSTAFVGIVFAGSALIPYQDPRAMVALRIYSLSLFAQAFFTVYTTALRGWQRMRAYSVLNAIAALIQCLVALWLFWRHGNLVQLAVLLLLAQVIAAIMAGFACKLALPRGLRLWPPEFARVRPLARASSPIALLSALGVLYQRSSLLLLPGLAGTTAAGWFSAGARVVEGAKTGHVAILTGIYPMMAAARVTQGAGWSRAFRVPWFVLLGGGLLGSVTLYLLAPALIPFLFGIEFTPSIRVLQILAWTLVPYATNSFLTVAFLAHGEEAAVIRALMLSIATLAVLTFLWAPQAGASGAALATLCAEAAQMLYLLGIDTRRGRLMATILRVVDAEK